MLGTSFDHQFLDTLCAVQMPLFPRLRSLDWNVCMFCWDPIHFFHPLLDRVKIEFRSIPGDDTHNMENSIARQLPTLTTDVRVLHCQYRYHGSEIHGILKEIILQLVDLQVVEIKKAGGVDDEMVAQCAKLSALQKLRIQMSGEPTGIPGTFGAHGILGSQGALPGRLRHADGSGGFVVPLQKVIFCRGQKV